MRHAAVCTGRSRPPRTCHRAKNRMESDVSAQKKPTSISHSTVSFIAVAPRLLMFVAVGRQRRQALRISCRTAPNPTCCNREYLMQRPRCLLVNTPNFCSNPVHKSGDCDNLVQNRGVEVGTSCFAADSFLVLDAARRQVRTRVGSSRLNTVFSMSALQAGAFSPVGKQRSERPPEGVCAARRRAMEWKLQNRPRFKTGT